MCQIGRKMIKAILFDKDGTLFDFDKSWGIWARGFIDDYTPDQAKRRALARGFELDYENSRFLPTSPIIAGTSSAIFSAIEAVFPDHAAAEIAQKVRYSTANAQMQPVTDLRPLLETLKARGLKLGIATNDDEAGAYEQLGREDVVELFDFIAGHDSGYGAKPAPGMCQGFLRAVQIEPENALMIGDSQHDIRSGQAAGMQTMGVLTGPANAAELSNADYVLDHIGLLPEWLEIR